jgi:hypothetical protein
MVRPPGDYGLASFWFDFLSSDCGIFTVGTGPAGAIDEVAGCISRKYIGVWLISILWFVRMVVIMRMTPSTASVVRHAECRLWSAERARLTFSRMSLALAVQMKGLGFSL